jgi:hypothetical protein
MSRSQSIALCVLLVMGLAGWAAHERFTSVPALAPTAPVVSVSQTERYPGPWVEDLHVGIARALVANNIGGCAYLKYKKSTQDSENYLTQCSRDGTHWRSYVVWVNLNEVVEQ